MSKPTKLLTISIIALLHFASGGGGRVEIFCTENCDCETFKNLRKASCANAKLSDIRDSAPIKTEWLDFSHNYVSKLEENEFINNDLTSLKLLNLSHNKINEIHIHAFSGMINLRSLDLSFNAIQHVSKEWFWELSKLEELYINNNNLDLRGGPIFASNSIKILNLSGCKIEHVPSKTFSEMPNLLQLDLTGNFFITINKNILTNLNGLKMISIANNDIVCTHNGEDFLQFCKENQITVDFNFCKEIEEMEESEEKFQRMAVAPKNFQNSWIIDSDEAEDTIEEKFKCPPVSKQEEEFDLLVKIFKLHPLIAIILLITTGFFIGIIVGCTCQIEGGKQKTTTEKTKRTRNRHSIIRHVGIESKSLMLNAEVTAESTPMPGRKVATP